jgi:GT2 family glycosyltransferase
VTVSTHQVPSPVEVAAGAGVGVATGRVAVLIVTWNRRELVSNVLRAVAGQTYGAQRLDVVVVDNASTDGTLEHLRAAFVPERVVGNDTGKAHEPRFAVPAPAGRNTLGFASLTIVRNTHNHGGCGGFNTGFAFTAEHLPSTEFAWLVDDDVDLAPGTLEHLHSAMAADPDAGLVGSRTIDLNDRTTTIETTIYFDAGHGRMGDHPPAGHRLEASHREWIARVGDVRGRGAYSGVREVDVVSACSLLARWSAVVAGDPARGRAPVGFWDARYFIYCDDADWCLRFAKAGWRVLVNLDAKVYHTPWHHKLTPARLYYAQRNRVWMCQKALGGAELKRVTWRMLWETLYDAAQAAGFRRLFHAEIIRQTASDAASGVAGKTAPEGPPLVPVVEALERCGCLRGGRVAVVLRHGDGAERFAAFRDRVESELRSRGRGERVEWAVIARNDVPNPPPGSLIYGGTWPSRIKKQLNLVRMRPRAVVVFDQTSDLPTITGGWTLHIDARTPDRAQVERDGLVAKARFAARWIATYVKCRRYAGRVGPFRSESRYG